MNLPLCKCGCGEQVSSTLNKWVNGHNRRNEKLSKDTKNKIGKKLKGIVPWNKGKNKNTSLGVLKQSIKMKELRENSESIYNSSIFKIKHIIRMNDNDVKNIIRKKSIGKISPNKGNTMSKTQKDKIRRKLILNIEYVRERYQFFSKIEKMRYNPDKDVEKEIQVHCKNHNCKNSEEQGGWFTPSTSQLKERIRQLETGNGGCYFYCSDECKNECPLYNLRSDPFKDNNDLSYTQIEYNQFRKFVLERDNYKCQYCGEKAEHVHHERPQKLEPFFVLDPDLAWSVCSSCHYEKGHTTGTKCSTGNLATTICK